MTPIIATKTHQNNNYRMAALVNRRGWVHTRHMGVNQNNNLYEICSFLRRYSLFLQFFLKMKDHTWTIYFDLKIRFWEKLSIWRYTVTLRLHNTHICTNTYGLLTECAVKMAGYWPSVFACLCTETKSRSINTQKKNEANVQPSWPNKLGQ